MQICRVTKVNGASMETFNLFTIHIFSGFLVSVVSVASVASVAFALVVRPEKLTQEFKTILKRPILYIEALYHGSDPWCLQFSLAVLNQSPDGVAPFNV